MSQPSKASPRDKAEMYIALNQEEALAELLKARPELVLQRKKGRTLAHLCQSKPVLLALVRSAEMGLQ
jgi:hypothetical protein